LSPATRRLRVLCFRDECGRCEPQRQRPEVRSRQRPEVRSLYNRRIRKGKLARVFSIFNWTELDVWQYIAEEALAVPSIYWGYF
jgi:sulfate adenylyltransferase subunit 2